MFFHSDVKIFSHYWSLMKNLRDFLSVTIENGI